MSSIPKPMGIQIEFDFAYESMTDFLTRNVHRISTDPAMAHLGRTCRTRSARRRHLQTPRAGPTGKFIG